MTMLTALSLTNYKVTAGALTTVSAHGLNVPKGIPPYMVPVKPTNAQALGLRYIARTEAWEKEGHPDHHGSKRTFMLTDKAVYIRLTIARAQTVWYPAATKVIYLCAVAGIPQGSVLVKCPDGLITVASGPMRVMTDAEAVATFKHLYSAPQRMTLKDAGRMGVIMGGDAMVPAVTTATVINAEGVLEGVQVRQRVRRMDF